MHVKQCEYSHMLPINLTVTTPTYCDGHYHSNQYIIILPQLYATFVTELHRGLTICMTQSLATHRYLLPKT